MRIPSKLLRSLLLLLTLLGSLPLAYAQNLVANPGFETGTFSGYTQSGNTSSTFVSSDATNVHSGSFAAVLGPAGSQGFLSQMLTTTPGGLYDFSFWLHNVGGGTPNNFSASFNGLTVFSLTNAPASPYAQFTFSGLLATSTSTLLQFSFRNDPGAFALDDISVTAAAPSAVPDAGSSALLLGLGITALGLGQRRLLRG